jgi:hypothetical protein
MGIDQQSGYIDLTFRPPLHLQRQLAELAKKTGLSVEDLVLEGTLELITRFDPTDQEQTVALGHLAAQNAEVSQLFGLE